MNKSLRRSVVAALLTLAMFTVAQAQPYPPGAIGSDSYTPPDTTVDGCSANDYGSTGNDDPLLAPYYPLDHCWHPGQPWNVYAPYWVATPTPDGIHPQLVLACRQCTGPWLYGTPTGDCVEWSNHRGDCAALATEGARADATLAAPQPTLTTAQCDEYLHFAGGTFIPPSCAAFATEVAVDKENWRATVEAFLAPRETEVAASGESGYCHDLRREGLIGMGCATSTPEPDASDDN